MRNQMEELAAQMRASGSMSAQMAAGYDASQIARAKGASSSQAGFIMSRGSEAYRTAIREGKTVAEATAAAIAIGEAFVKQGGGGDGDEDEEEEEEAAATPAEEAEAEEAAPEAPAPAEEPEAKEPEAKAPEPEAEAPAKPTTLTSANKLRQQQKEQKEACKAGYREGEAYLDATKRAKKCLETFATPRLRLYPMGKKAIQESAAGNPVLATGLINYSPKFAEILTRILESPGSSLVYSQFLDMEGIGIFQTVLRINDFLPLTLESDDAGSFRFSEATIKGLSKPNTYRWLSFTGSESREQKAMALRVFNARYDEEKKVFTELPPAMSAALVAAGFTGNLRGELCRVFCITSAGAEGLSLRNVRRVHIMEPYWNHVRTDQVKGRAVRICSHIDLEYSDDPLMNQRTVEVFTYCSVFHPSSMVTTEAGALYPAIDVALTNMDGIKPADATELGLPIPEGARDYVMTSDEYLYVLSENKKKLLMELQNLMKTSAVDCEINEYENEDDGLGCLVLPGKSEDYAYDPVLSRDITDTASSFETKAATGAATGLAGLAGPAAGPGAGTVAAPQAQAQTQTQAQAQTQAPAPKPKPSVKAQYIKVDGKVKYLAVPTVGPGGAILSYKIFAAGDTKAKILLGTTLANPAGGPSVEDIVLV